MEKELVDKVLEKNFIELNERERDDLKEWCSSEEEFDQLKMVFRGVEQLKVSQTFNPSPETKRSLDSLFAEQHAKVPGTIWYNSILAAIYPTDKSFARRPLIQLAAVGLIVLLAYPFIGVNDMINKKNEVAQLEETKDISTVKAKETTGENFEAADKTLVQNEVAEEIIVDEISPFEVSMEKSLEESKFDEIESATFTGIAAMPMRNVADIPVSTHPDGIFIGASAVTYSQPASAQPAVFDLLTTTF